MSDDVVDQLTVVLDQYFYYTQTLHQLCFTLSISEIQQTYNSTGEKNHKHETETKII